MVRSPTDERNQAISAAQIEYERKRRENGGAGWSLVREADCADHEDCPVRQGKGRAVTAQQVEALTDDEARGRPVSLGLLAMLFALCAAVLGGWVALESRLGAARARALAAHSTASTSHPDLRAASVAARQQAREERLAIRADLRELTGLLRHGMLDAAKAKGKRRR